MDTSQKRNFSKLLLGGCGTQVGMVFAFALLVVTLVFCSFCALTNVLSIVVAQEIAGLSSDSTVEAASNAEAEVLREEMESLVSQVESLRANESNVPVATAAPSASPKPIVVAQQSGANLRSGPGLNYNKLGVLAHGGQLEIVGRNADSSWWLVSASNGLAWVSADVVEARNVDESIPVVTIPALLVLPATGDAHQAAPTSTVMPTVPATPTPTRPSGTPTAAASESRIFVEDTVGYKRLREQLSVPPTSESFSPRGDKIAVIDGIKLHIVAGDASYGRDLFADNDIMRPVGDAVWSPNGEYIAFVVDYKSRKCRPCRSVGLARLSDESVVFLKTPDNLDSDGPRWTQDGRLLVNVHPGEPADGTTYVYNTSGRGQVASGVYVLSSSHEGQKWLPWRPGRIWRAGVTERPDAYYSD